MRVIYLIPPLVGSRFSDAAASQVASLDQAAARTAALAPNLNFAHCGSPLL